MIFFPCTLYWAFESVGLYTFQHCSQQPEKFISIITCTDPSVHGKPPHLHLTTSKVMVIVWRIRRNIIRTVLYIANVLPLQWAQLTKTVHTARLGLEFVFLCSLGCMIYHYVGVCFVLPWTVESFPFMLWRWRNKLK